MRKIFLFTFILLIFSPAAARVTVELKFDRPGGWDWDSQMFMVRCLDPFTGEVIEVKSTLEPGKTYSFKVDKNKHPQIVCYVSQWYTNGHYTSGPIVLRKKIELSNMWENGWIANYGEIPSGDEIGDCGDGKVTGMETCDTNGNRGCTPPNGKCYKCEYCGCGKDDDCPKIEGPTNCGYGKCGEYERPDWYSYCHDGKVQGVCMKAYKCKFDSSCVPGTMPEDKEKNDTYTVCEADISSNETMEKKFNIIFFNDLGGGKDLEIMIHHIDENLQQLPDAIKSIFGDEKMNIYVEDENIKMFLVTQEGRVVEAGEGQLLDQSLNIYTDKGTIEQLMDGSLEFSQAIEEDRIHYEGQGVINSLKFTILNFLSSLMSGFTDQP